MEHAEWSKVPRRLNETLTNAFKGEQFPIFIHGTPGNGKSCAMACVYQRWSKPIARWYRLEQFVRDIQAARHQGHVEMPVVLETGERATIKRSERKLWQFVEDPQQLWCFDDFGTRDVTASAFDIVFELIDRRGRRPMIVTSNLSLDDIAELYDARIADRLGAGTVIECTGRSRRKGTRNKVN